MQGIKSLFVTLVAVLTLAGCASDAGREGSSIDDAVVTTRVKAAMFNEPAISAGEVNVETHDGVVQLSGFVSSAATRSKAVEIARSVKGVKSVKNDIRLK
jgi:osmotically-inducible protein OsmY